MARPDITTCALLGLTLAFASCVPPKAAVVAPPVAKTEEKKDVPEPVVPEPLVPALPDDGGIRMPNFTDLPSDADFRGGNAAAPKAEPGSGAVISRPPTDPPSRVKAKPAEKE